MKEMTNTGAEMIFRDLNSIPFGWIILTIISSLIIIFLIKRLIPWFAEKLPPRFRLYLLPAIPLMRLLIIVFAFLIILPQIIRPTLQNFLAISGAIGLALGFAFKDFASSLIAGIIAIYEQPYRPGDRVTIDNVYGEVKSVNLRSLRILTHDDTIVTVPHSKLWNGNIFNSNDGCREQLCVADFYLNADHNAVEIRQCLRDAALSSPYIQLNKPVRVNLKETPWGTHYRIKAYPVDGRDEFSFVSDLTVRGKEVLQTRGVKFASLPYAAGVKEQQ